MALNRQLSQAVKGQAPITAVVAGPYQFTNLIANGTTTIFVGPGILHAVVVNRLGSGGNQVKIADSSSSSLPTIATLDTTVKLGTFLYNAWIATGLTIQLENGVAADITVLWG